MMLSKSVSIPLLTDKPQDHTPSAQRDADTPGQSAPWQPPSSPPPAAAPNHIFLQTPLHSNPVAPPTSHPTDPRPPPPNCPSARTRPAESVSA